jgi:hypothetical protein
MSRFLFLTIFIVGCASAAGLAGTWEGSLQDSTYAGFDIDVNGDRVSGDAYISGWGFAHIAGARVEGNRVSFSVNGVAFEGSIDGDAMSLKSTDGGRYAATLQRTQSHVTGPISLDATAKDLEGAWKTRWAGRIGERPKMIGSMRIDFKADANGLTGIAHMEGWPGDCPITDFKLERGQISFTAKGRIPSSSGIPVMRFEGEVHGSQLKLTMRHQIFGADSGVGLPLDAVRD